MSSFTGIEQDHDRATDFLPILKIQRFQKFPKQWSRSLKVIGNDAVQYGEYAYEYS